MAGHSAHIQREGRVHVELEDTFAKFDVIKPPLIWMPAGYLGAGMRNTHPHQKDSHVERAEFYN